MGFQFVFSIGLNFKDVYIAALMYDLTVHLTLVLKSVFSYGFFHLTLFHTASRLRLLTRGQIV